MTTYTIPLPTTTTTTVYIHPTDPTYVNDPISIDLRYNGSTHINLCHCILCGFKLLQYRGKIVSVMPGLVPCKLPIIVQCYNPRCKTKYQVGNWAYGLDDVIV